MKILYLIRTHQKPDQIYRLVRTIRKANPSSIIVLSHSAESAPLDLSPLSDLPGHPIQCLYASVRRCDMSLVNAYLDAVEWIYSQNIEFDWLVNLSGQCYPTQPLQNLENLLNETEYDGFMEHFELFSGGAPWPLEQCKDRYLYHYWKTGMHLSHWQLTAIKPLIAAVNRIQNFIRLHWFNNELILGRHVSTPFNSKFIGYGGSYFHMLSADCVKFLLHFLRSAQGRRLIDFYEDTLIPDESIFQTVLVNNGSFKFYGQNIHYISWSKPNDGRPGIVSSEHLPKLARDDIFFARKFDVEKDPEILSALDERIFAAQG